ncbi:hypothetical protein E4U43_008067 [Claviceps pusilla]|uniref:AMP-dependent synthetase/ligase domain-containing protein n=1 Tax=Claviceps pusilla TaxID=123648 RepID=A0A9P7NDU6_9HYPO|nr:hypothetical protein E4U43_008067 [Claviceps pusilla]
MTPSVGSMLRPSDLSGTLEHIVFAGEALPTYLAAQWAAYLPAYMIPSAYIPFKSFSKTPNGKLDRRKLRKLYKASTTQELAAKLRLHQTRTNRSPILAEHLFSVVSLKNRIPPDWSVRDLIAAVHRQQPDTMPFETRETSSAAAPAGRNGPNSVPSSCTKTTKAVPMTTKLGLSISTVLICPRTNVDSVEVYITSTPGPTSTEIHMGFATPAVAMAPRATRSALSMCLNIQLGFGCCCCERMNCRWALGRFYGAASMV